MRYIGTHANHPFASASEAVLLGMVPRGGLFVPEFIPRLEADTLTAPDYLETARRIAAAYFTDFEPPVLDGCLRRRTTRTTSTPDVVAPAARPAPLPPRALPRADGRVQGRRPSVDAPPDLHGQILTGDQTLHSDPGRHVRRHRQGRPGGLQERRRHFHRRVLSGRRRERGSAPPDGHHRRPEHPGLRRPGQLRRLPNRSQGPFPRRQPPRLPGRAEHQALDGQFHQLGPAGPQIVYYVRAYALLAAGGEIKTGDEVDICVPTGNFGNILAAWYARAMGLPSASSSAPPTKTTS